jgi:hypothetical protein
MNIFKGLSRRQIVIVVLLGTVVAVVLTVALVTLVSLFSISDKAKCQILFNLGIASWFIGYLVLIRTPAQNQQKAPPSAKPVGNSHDSLNGPNEINKNFSNTPVVPSKVIVSNNAPTAISMKTPSALSILSSFHCYLTKVLHNVL